MPEPMVEDYSKHTPKKTMVVARDGAHEIARPCEKGLSHSEVETHISALLSSR